MIPADPVAGWFRFVTRLDYCIDLKVEALADVMPQMTYVRRFTREELADFAARLLLHHARETLRTLAGGSAAGGRARFDGVDLLPLDAIAPRANFTVCVPRAINTAPAVPGEPKESPT